MNILTLKHDYENKIFNNSKRFNIFNTEKNTKYLNKKTKL